MILFTCALLGFATADLIRWSPLPVSNRRSLLALGGATAATVVLACLSDMGFAAVVLTGIATLIAVGAWVRLDGNRVAGPLTLIGVVFLVLFLLSGEAEAGFGPLENWYLDLPFGFVDTVSVDRFMLALTAFLFLLSTTNRIVRLVLDAAGTPAEDSEGDLKGGRVLGPMERLTIAALILSGNPEGIAIVFAAKGLLRFPEIRDSHDKNATEYFLIGTFASLLLAAGVALLISGAR